MSYDCGANGRHISGTFASALSLPLTIAAWVKLTAGEWGQTAANYVAYLGMAGTGNNQMRLQTNDGAADRVSAVHRDSSASSGADNSFTPGDYDATWVLVVGTYVGVSERHAFIETSANVANDTTPRSEVTNIDFFRIGSSNDAFESQPGLIAEVGVWDIELSNANIDALQTASETGVKMSSIAAANNVGHWSLLADSSTHASTDGAGVGPTLTVTNAVFNSDHPNIPTGIAAKASAMRLFM